MGSATVPIAALGVAPTAPGAPGRHQMGLDLGREMFSASRRRAVRALWRALKAGGRKLRARRPRSPKQLHRSGQAGLVGHGTRPR